MGNSHATHLVELKTGVKKGAGVNANVFVRLGDSEGKWSKESLIDNALKDDFESGNTDSFYLCLPSMKRKVTELEIRRDSTGANDDWYLERVTVKNLQTADISYFPANRWIHAHDQLRLSQYDYSLPSQDKYLDQRKRELEKKRALYQLVVPEPGIPAAICQPMPADEEFNCSYQLFVAGTTIILNIQEKVAGWLTSDFESLEDFQDIYLFARSPLPEGALKWKSDESFGNQRLTGANPAMIELCRKIPRRFAVTSKMVEPFLEGQTLPEAMARKKIYIEDLSFLENLICGDGKKFCSPYGLFYVRKSGDLVPIAIQIEAEPAADNPVFVPSDPEYTWILAKMFLNLADAAVHQCASHLGLTHLVMESVAVCANRQLSPSHPIFKLMAPHFLYLIAMNTLGLTQLTAPGSWADQTLQVGRAGLFEIIRRKWANWKLNEDGNFLKNLEKRGVDDETALPNYHYRDDGKLIWNAITEYVTDIVDKVYDKREKLLNDYEIQAFVAELSASDGAAVKGVPSKLTRTAELKELLATVIFTCSAQHAAVNFGQYDEYGFSPNYSARIRSERPKTKATLTEEDIVAALPSRDQALKIISVTGLLSSKATNQLGYFEMEYTADPLSREAIKKFRSNLAHVAAIIDQKNEKRANKYTYLHPKEVPNAISI